MNLTIIILSISAYFIVGVLLARICVKNERKKNTSIDLPDCVGLTLFWPIILIVLLVRWLIITIDIYGIFKDKDDK